METRNVQELGGYQEQGKGWVTVGDSQGLKGLGERRRELGLMVEERAASCWRDTGRGERVEWPWGLPGALRGCCGKGRVWDNQRGHRVRGRGGAEGHGGKRQPGAGRGKVVTRIVRVWGLWGKLYLLTCPTRESHFSPGPLTTHCLLVSWVERLAPHKVPGFPLPLWELFLQAMGYSDWEHAEGNALTLRPFKDWNRSVQGGEACALGRREIRERNHLF